MVKIVSRAEYCGAQNEAVQPAPQPGQFYWYTWHKKSQLRLCVFESKDYTDLGDACIMIDMDSGQPVGNSDFTLRHVADGSYTLAKNVTIVTEKS